MTMRVKHEHDHGVVLERIGFTPIDHTYIMDLQ
jgi:hypothetical protein